MKFGFFFESVRNRTTRNNIRNEQKDNLKNLVVANTHKDVSSIIATEDKQLDEILQTMDMEYNSIIGLVESLILSSEQYSQTIILLQQRLNDKLDIICGEASCHPKFQEILGKRELLLSQFDKMSSIK